MEEMLSRLAGMGRLDSQGSFSLDPARARLLLEKYRLPSAVYFMLHAVGAAVCSQASRVDIELRSDRFRLTFDGDPFGPDDVDHCFASLWSPERDRAVMRLRELAIARGGAPGWGATDFRIAPAPDRRQSIVVERKGLRSKMRRMLGVMAVSEEYYLLRQHLLSTPECQLWLNGRDLGEMKRPTRALRAASWRAPELLEQLETRQPARHLDQLAGLSADQQALLAGCRGLVCQLYSGALPAGADIIRSPWPGYLDLVLNGRLYRCALPRQWKDRWGLFWVSGCRRDLSHTNINSDDLQLFHRLLEVGLAEQ
ncbi:MAG: hypothetical protein KC910_33810 [Candidatus Eremiobacteraeota bacterium]|nr:hypothetical protein [Candidatus Eremiobacteraeota bacterium]